MGMMALSLASAQTLGLPGPPWTAVAVADPPPFTAGGGGSPVTAAPERAEGDRSIFSGTTQNHATERGGCASAVLERQKRSEFEFGVVDLFLCSAVSLAATRCVMLPAD